MTDEEIRERLAQSQIEFDAAQAKQREQEALTAALAHLSREANAGADGQPWVQPTGAHDACPAGSVRTHKGEHMGVVGSVQRVGTGSVRLAGEAFRGRTYPVGAAHGSARRLPQGSRRAVRWP